MKTIAVAMATILLTVQVSHAAPNAISTLPEWAASLVRSVPFISAYFTDTFENAYRPADAASKQSSKQILAPQVRGHQAMVQKIDTKLVVDQRAPLSSAQKAAAATSARLQPSAPQR